MAPEIVQVPSPPGSSVGESGQVTALPRGSVTVQVSVPVGVTPGGEPDTVAVNMKAPPVTTPVALLLTVVMEALAAPAGAATRPSETTHVTVPMKAMSHFLILV